MWGFTWGSKAQQEPASGKGGQIPGSLGDHHRRPGERHRHTGSDLDIRGCGRSGHHPQERVMGDVGREDPVKAEGPSPRRPRRNDAERAVLQVVVDLQGNLPDTPVLRRGYSRRCPGSRGTLRPSTMDNEKVLAIGGGSGTGG